MVITTWISARIEQEGAITIPARMFTDLVGSLPQQQVEITLNEKSLHVECGRTEANLNGIDANEFPAVPEANLDEGIQLKAGTFKEMIAQVAFAAATDDTRPTLAGVSMQLDGNTIKMAATDAFRLSVRSAELDASLDSKSIIIPARALNEVARAISNDDSVIYLIIPEGRGQIIFAVDNAVIVAQLIEGNFPDFTPIIPKKHSTRAVMNTAALLKACRTALVFAREARHTAKVAFKPEPNNGKLHLYFGDQFRARRQCGAGGCRD